MSLIDWIIVAVFFIGITAIGFGFSRKNTNVGEYFTAGRNMPTWIVSFAVVGTSISAGTFVGAPQFAYEGNLGYLMLGVGGIIGGIIVALIFVPVLYRANTVTVYGYIGQRFGTGAATASSVVFLFGQLLTSGARLYIAAIAVSVILYGDIIFPNLIVSIVLLGGIATAYTVAGGIRALLYIDTLQIIIVLISGLICIVAISVAIPVGWSSIIGALVHSPSGNKLALIDLTFSFTRPYNVMGTLIGFTIFKIAQYGTDHEFAQRVLVCRSVKKACTSLVTAQLLSLPIVFVFLVIGLLLYIFYARPDIMGTAAPADVLRDSRQVFPQYIFLHFRTGLLGITAVGLLAAALSSFNSAINAMASSLATDIIKPLAAKSGRTRARFSEVGGSRLVSTGTGIALTAFAIIAAYIQQTGGQTLLDFALGIMSFGYAGLLGVFLCAIFTKRGNVKSVIAALVTGALVVLLLQPQLMKVWTPVLFGQGFGLAWTWWVAVGAACSFAVCSLGKPREAAAPMPGVK